MSEAMLQQKLTACRDAYEEEFETLARQFGELKAEVDTQRDREAKLRTKILEQEKLITNLNNLVEASGHDLLIGDSERRMSEPIEGNDQMDLINFATELADDPDSQHPEAIEVIAKSDVPLTQPF